MLSFYIMMFLVPVLIISLSVGLALNTKFK